MRLEVADLSSTLLLVVKEEQRDSVDFNSNMGSTADFPNMDSSVPFVSLDRGSCGCDCRKTPELEVAPAVCLLLTAAPDESVPPMEVVKLQGAGAEEDAGDWGGD